MTYQDQNSPSYLSDMPAKKDKLGRKSYIDTVKKLQKLGLANTSKYFTNSFVTNNNSNANLDFILKSLK